MEERMSPSCASSPLQRLMNVRAEEVPAVPAVDAVRYRAVSGVLLRTAPNPRRIGRGGRRVEFAVAVHRYAAGDAGSQLLIRLGGAQLATAAVHCLGLSFLRTAFFANIDVMVNAMTLLLQLFVRGRMLAAAGIVATLCLLPLVNLLGFAALAASPGVAVIVAAQVARRVANFALARPAREILFTSSAREDRYKAQNFIDTVVYRGGDQLASWGYAGLMGLGLIHSWLPYLHGIPS